ncbi:MAG: DUF4276 family protein [Candidatus Eremiobacteraeota bacterium]|nr:DUF4276 family protein [Candidatus Eremiobacteraeota bacterium]MCW5872861.1 DUF4276 family protein [Candidatus Eremiobacteraeota bacterium]
MPRLYVFAEGQTEQTFANLVLRDHLASFGVYLQPAVLIAHARKKGKTHRGGGRRYQPLRKDVETFLRQEKSNDVFFTTMIDLYALYSDFPGQQEAAKLSHLPYERVKFLESAFHQDLGGDPRLIPHLQLHEFEACLYCKPEAFVGFYPGTTREVGEIRAIAEAYDSPELINDGQHTAPSKRIAQHFPDYLKAKSVVGPALAAQIGLSCIRERCPHFDLWLTRLETLV